MKTVYLHIGCHKTGTSALQSFLKNNAAELNAFGCSYPILPLFPNNRNGTFLLNNIDSNIFKTSLKKISDELIKQDSIVLSQEHLSYNLIYNSRIPSAWVEHKESCNLKNNFLFFKNYCDKNHYKVIVIVYLRRQDRMLESLDNQFIKESYKFVNLPSAKKFFNKFLHYKKLLSALEEIFYKENIVVRSYDKLINNNIIDDFMQIIHPGNSKRYPYGQDTNKKLELNALYIKRIFNRTWLGLPYAQKRAFGYDILSNCDFHHFENCSVMSKKYAKRLMKRLEQENKDLSIKYNNGVDLFDNDYSNYGKVYSPYNEFMKDDINKIRQYCKINSNKIDSHLKENIESSLNKVENLPPKIVFNISKIKNYLISCLHR